MARIIRQSEMSFILDTLAVRSDLQPGDQLKGLRALRYRMVEHLENDALALLEAEIKRIEELGKIE